MPDNRNYAVGMKNEGGAPVYMEDMKLSERSAVPNAASIANLKFLLTTDDDEGFRTAIKAYIDEAIRSALGALVDNLDKGTGVSRILCTDSNHDLGTITPSTLTSVLGDSLNYEEVCKSSTQQTINLSGYGIYIVVEKSNTGASAIFAMNAGANGIDMITDPMSMIKTSGSSGLVFGKPSSGSSGTLTNYTGSKFTVIHIGDVR